MDHYFFLNDTATTEIYTLSLHDALPISGDGRTEHLGQPGRLLLVRRLRHDVLGGSEGRTRGGVHGPGPGLDPAALPPPHQQPRLPGHYGVAARGRTGRSAVLPRSHAVSAPRSDSIG